MKNILILVLLVFSVPCNAMEQDSNDAKKSFSPGPTRKQISQHARHRSLSGKVLDILHLRTDEIKPLPLNVAALISDRSSPEIRRKDEEKESPKTNKLSASNSPRKCENNKNSYAKAVSFSHSALKKIQSLDDAHAILECQQYINNARYFYTQMMQNELPNVERAWIDRAVDDEIKPLQTEYDTKIASLKELQKK